MVGMALAVNAMKQVSVLEQKLQEAGILDGGDQEGRPR